MSYFSSKAVHGLESLHYFLHGAYLVKIKNDSETTFSSFKNKIGDLENFCLTLAVYKKLLL